MKKYMFLLIGVLTMLIPVKMILDKLTRSML